MRKTYIVLALAGAFCATTLQASLVNTGIDAGNDGIDDNWELVAVNPAGAPGGESTPNAYVTDSTGGGFPWQYWINNDPTSSWITYSEPLYTGGDTTRDYTYQLAFMGAGNYQVRWLSDNNSTLYLDGVEVGTRSPGTSYSTFNSWNAWTPLNVAAGNHLLEVVVRNVGQDSGNPTGMRFEAVPEPGTVIAGALLLLPFGASAVRILRKNRVA